MNNIKCPKCGSYDCKEKTITFEKVLDGIFDFGGAILRGMIKGGSTSESIQIGGLRHQAKGGYNNHCYKCRNCGHEWKR